MHVTSAPVIYKNHQSCCGADVALSRDTS